MTIDVIATAQQVNEAMVKDKTVVVIDVLRATSVMVNALNNGVLSVVPVLSPEDAFGVKNRLNTPVLLGGERNAEPIEGFDYGNSPLSYSNEVVNGKTLVMTTTNGTLAIHNSLAANELLIGSFLNDKAIANELRYKQDVVLVCSGNNGLYTLEDALCAGRIMHLLVDELGPVQLSDFALSTKALYDAHHEDIIEIASQGYHYQVLKQKGYQNDLAYCFQSGVCQNIPVLKEDRLVNME